MDKDQDTVATGTPDGAPRDKVVDVMIDIEAMGQGTRGAICAIGATPFERRGGEDPTLEEVMATGFQQAVSIASSVKAGMQTDGATIAWWLDQSDQARRALLDKPIGAKEAISALRKYLAGLCGNEKHLRVWAKPSKFDIAALEELCVLLGTRPPWISKSVRDLTSLIDVALTDGPEPGTAPVRLPETLKSRMHISLVDCYGQILVARQCFRMLDKYARR
jgi:exodeoxyribonuclease VIII